MKPTNVPLVEKETRRLQWLNVMLSQGNRIILRAQSRDELFRAFCEMAVQQGGFKLAWIGWLDNTGKVLVPVVSVGKALSRLNPIHLDPELPVEVGGIAATYLREGNPWICHRLADDPQMKPGNDPGAALGCSASASFPIRQEGEVRGALTLYSTEFDFFQEPEIGLFTDLCLNISFVVDQMEKETQRRRETAALQRAKGDWECVFQAMVHPTVILDPQFQIIAANQAMLRVAGMDEPALLGKRCFEMFHGCGRDCPPAGCPMELLLTSGRVAITDMEMEAFNRLFLVSCTPMLDESGNLQKVLHISTDITARKCTEEALRQSEERYRHIVDTAYEGIWMFNRDFRITFANHRLAEMLGWRVEELIGQPLETVIFEEDLADNAVRLENRRKLWREQYERRLRRRDGGMLWTIISSSPLVDAEHRFNGSFSMVTDITERKQAEEALKKSEERFVKVFRSSPAAIAITRLSDGRILDVNEAVLKMFGYRREELINRTTVELGLWANPEERTEFVRALAVGEAIRDREFTMRAKDGQVRHANFYAESIEIEGDRYAISLILDMTEQKKTREVRTILETQLRQMQKMEAVGSLAGGIAHDFNNILGAIICYGELAKQEAFGNPEMQDYVDNILRASERAKDLVRQILAFSRQSMQERKPTALRLVIKEALRLLRSTLPTTIEMVSNIANDLPLVEADPTQIHQIVMNLCTNAAHAMRGTMGRLEVRLAGFAVDETFALTHPDLHPGPHVRLTVSDTGHGMNDETLQRIFDPFFTTKAPGEGTGLGLSVVHGIVKEHRGAVEVISEPGKGTTFQLYFPALAEVGNREEADAAPIIRGQGERVLLVDDEPDLCRAGAALLEWLGYQPTTQTDARQALAMFQAQPKAFDVVLTDLTMPGLTGIDLAVAILVARPVIPVLLTTGYVGNWSRELVRSRGIREVVAKPLNSESLSRVLHEVLHESDPSADSTAMLDAGGNDSV